MKLVILSRLTLDLWRKYIYLLYVTKLKICYVQQMMVLTDLLTELEQGVKVWVQTL